MMKLITTNFNGLYLIEGNLFTDVRGTFLKTYNKTIFAELGLETDYTERYYSTSHKNVIRGMHFQVPPHDHIKLVSVLNGSILDVVIDIRKDSATYGQFFSIQLNDKSGQFLYIPKGFAHGFKALEDNTIVEYNQTTEYSKECDNGIKWDSFEFDWQTPDPIISDRDKSFVTLTHFNSPF